MRKQITLLFSLVCFMFSLAYAQQVNIKGTIRDKSGAAIPGVSVKVKNATSGVSSGGEGEFTISASQQATLIFSAVGYASQEIQVNRRTTLNVTLAEESQDLTDVVVIGYGTTTKRDATGAISSVKATQLENENPQSLSDVLRGNVPGLSVGLSSSAKGGGDFLVRGKSTLSAGSSPLIVLDGVIYNGQLADINPNDIESVDVLKDASSLAVYGAKAATGVIAVTTKKGRGDMPTITINTNAGFAELAKNMRPYQGEDFLAWRGDVMRSGAVTPEYLYNDPRNLPTGVTITQWLNGQTGDPVDLWLNRLGLVANEKANYLAGKTENWYDDIFRRGFRQDHTLSLSGRKQEVNYYMSLNYQKNQNLIEGGEYTSIRGRVNLEAEAAKFLTLGLNLQFADRDEARTGDGSLEADWNQLTNLSPYGDRYLPNGELRRIPTDDSGLNARNPFLSMTYNERMNKQNTIFASLYGKVKLPFGITYQLNFSPGLDFYRTFDYRSSRNPDVVTPGGSASRPNETRYNWQIDNLIKWNKTFAGIHNVDVTLLANAEKYQTWWTQAANEGFVPGDVLSYHNLASGIKPTTNSEDKVYTGDALMARVNYSLLQRYILTLSVRRDGYSVFGFNFKRATFPAAAFAWVFTDESFMKNQKWLNYGKLRLSYGINGNRDLRNPDNGTVDPYAALAQLASGKYQTVTPGGVASDVNTVQISSKMANANLKWEETTAINFGLDFSLFNDRITGSIDGFSKKTSDLLVRQTLPNVSGYSTVYSNLARINNKGGEFNLTTKNLTEGNIKWTTNFNISFNRNKIIALALPTDDPGNGWFIGKDIDIIWDYNLQGVWQANEMAEAAKFTRAAIKPGDFKLEDVNGDYNYSDADKKFLGYRTPRYFLAMRNEFNIFKNFDFSFQLLSNWGQLKQYNQAKNQPGSVGFARASSYVLPYWTPNNPINDYARLNSGSSGTSYNVYWDNSFIRLNTVALSYSVPQNLLGKLRVKTAKIYANVTNAGYYAPQWTFWDPQNNGPTPRLYTLGLNVTL
ncbi:SusC/RagA family TonB-linked outer membrane protein [Pedobacter sp.]|uniref:SusC/RagA family TonB-linked outer membrane protein n=1 Tax=Pedobacter sp. TaxID=1411316 RepID=UPI003BA95817